MASIVGKMKQSSGPSQKNRPKIMATIPCFNNQRFIADLVSRTKEYVDEVIVVDDGSTDDTAKLARMAGATVIHHDQNRGYGWAIKSCFKAVKANAADVLVILDGDGQHDPDDLPQILAPILSEEVDLVIGSRFLQSKESIADVQRSALKHPKSKPSSPDSELNAMPRYRKFGIYVITLLFNFGSRTKISDAQSGFRAYSKRLFEALSLSENNMSVSIESLDKARRQGAIIYEVPIHCKYNHSSINLHAIRHGLIVAISVIRIRLKNILLDFIA